MVIHVTFNHKEIGSNPINLKRIWIKILYIGHYHMKDIQHNFNKVAEDLYKSSITAYGTTVI